MGAHGPVAHGRPKCGPRAPQKRPMGRPKGDPVENIWAADSLEEKSSGNAELYGKNDAGAWPARGTPWPWKPYFDIRKVLKMQHSISKLCRSMDTERGARTPHDIRKVLKTQHSISKLCRSMVTERGARAHQILKSHQECIDLGVGGPPVQRLCLEYKSNESAELYTKKVPHHGQREGTKRNTRTLGFLIVHQ